MSVAYLHVSSCVYLHSTSQKEQHSWNLQHNIQVKLLSCFNQLPAIALGQPQVKLTSVEGLKERLRGQGQRRHVEAEQ